MTSGLGPEPVYISFSEIETFLRCRYKWDLSSANRKSIRHKVTPALYLSVGSAVHKALEAGVRGEDPVEAAKVYLETERAARVQAYVEEHGNEPWPMEMAKFDEATSLGLALVGQYHARYPGSNPLAEHGLTMIGIEVPFKIDITQYVVPRPEQAISVPVYFCGTIDGIAIDGNGNIWIVENKTFTRKPSTEDVQWHFQAMGYAVALEMLTGLQVTGVLYNGIAKKIISVPKVLKSNGRLSTNKSCATTLDRYLAAIQDNGEDPEDPRFTDILSHLQGLHDQGDTRFFYREKLFYQREQLDAWTADFFQTVYDMLDQPRIYRTIPYDGCGDCWFKDLCHASHSGGDPDYILETRYQIGTYGTVTEVQGKEPTVITSVDGLKAYLNDI